MVFFSAFFTGVLRGSHKAIPAPTIDENAAIRNGDDRCSMFRALTITQAPIHPNEPNRRIRENSFPGSFKFENEIELHKAVVGI